MLNIYAHAWYMVWGIVIFLIVILSVIGMKLEGAQNKYDELKKKYDDLKESTNDMLKATIVKHERFEFFDTYKKGTMPELDADLKAFMRNSFLVTMAPDLKKYINVSADTSDEKEDKISAYMTIIVLEEEKDD